MKKIIVFLSLVITFNIILSAYTYSNITDENSPSDDDSENDLILAFENDANLTIPLAMFIFAVCSC